MISTRLQAIIDLLKAENDKNTINIADIGSDHGYLLIELAKRNIGNKLFGVENKAGPFEHLKTNIVKSLNKNEQDKIIISFSSGLEQVGNEYNTIVIAGMGFLTIKSIIESHKKQFGHIIFDTFIFDSHTMTAELRHYMHDNGFNIENEVCLYDKKVYYEIILFKKSDELINYNDIDYKYGPILRKNKNDDFIKYYSNQILKLENQLNTINFDEEKRNNKVKLMNEMKSIIN